MSHTQPTGSSGFATDLRPILTMPGASQDFQTTHRPPVRLSFGFHVCQVHLIHSLPRFGAGTQPGHGVSPANKKNILQMIKSADPGLRQGRGGAWDHRRCGSCLSWTLATPNAAGKSHHKATAMAQEHPTAAAMASFLGVQGCRLPGLKPSKPSNSSKSLPTSAGKRYPNKPNTRHSRTQKPPQGHSNGWRAPPGRSNGFL